MRKLPRKAQNSRSIILATTGWGLLLCNSGFVLPPTLGSDWITRLFISVCFVQGWV
jgi:hypothetical protein